jgi:hypothetical protein
VPASLVGAGGNGTCCGRGGSEGKGVEAEGAAVEFAIDGGGGMGNETGAVKSAFEVKVEVDWVKPARAGGGGNG